MKAKIFIKKNGLFIFIFIFFIATYGAMNSLMVSTPVKEIEIFLTRTCGCCKKWAEHIEQNGLKTKLTYVDDLSDVKTKNNVPRNLASCHTAIIDGYVVEGHVPAQAVIRMITEKPDIKGIGVPGMPVGSPGMEGGYPEKYDVITFDKNNMQSVYETYNQAYEIK